MKRGCVKFIGFGGAIPDINEMFNNDQVLQKLRDKGFDTKGKIGQDTENLMGIKKRWLSTLSSFELAHIAASVACVNAESRTGFVFSSDKLGLIHSGGSSPDDVFPACACRLQHKLWVNCEARDISLACASWLDAVLLAASRMRDKNFRYGLVAVGETIGSRLNAPTTLSYSLWGDGGGAVVLEFDPNGDSSYGIIVDKAISDGQYADWAKSEGLGTHPDHRTKELNASMGRFGTKIQSYVIKVLPQHINNLLDELAIGTEEYPYLLPHNANLKMVEAIGKKIGLPPERVLTMIAERGNTSSASIPITLAHYESQGKFKRGDLLIFAAFGSGMSIDLMLYRWP